MTHRNKHGQQHGILKIETHMCYIHLFMEDVLNIDTFVPFLVSIPDSNPIERSSAEWRNLDGH